MHGTITMVSPPTNLNDTLESGITFPEVCLRLCEEVAKRSKDPSTKVGSVIWDPRDKLVLSVGYNGFPSTLPDLREIWENRTDATKIMKYDLVIHAEMNAILNARCDLRGKHIFITHKPCPTCAKHIAACGITATIWPDGASAKSQGPREHDITDYIFTTAKILLRKKITT